MKTTNEQTKKEETELNMNKQTKHISAIMTQCPVCLKRLYVTINKPNIKIRLGINEPVLVQCAYCFATFNCE